MTSGEDTRAQEPDDDLKNMMRQFLDGTLPKVSVAQAQLAIFQRANALARENLEGQHDRPEDKGKTGMVLKAGLQHRNDVADTVLRQADELAEVVEQEAAAPPNLATTVRDLLPLEGRPDAPPWEDMRVLMGRLDQEYLRGRAASILDEIRLAPDAPDPLPDMYEVLDGIWAEAQARHAFIRALANIRPSQPAEPENVTVENIPPLQDDPTPTPPAEPTPSAAEAKQPPTAPTWDAEDLVAALRRKEANQKLKRKHQRALEAWEAAGSPPLTAAPEPESAPATALVVVEVVPLEPLLPPPTKTAEIIDVDFSEVPPHEPGTALVLVGEPLEPMYPLAEAERIRKRELHQRANLQRLLLAFDWLYDRIVEPAPVADVAWDDGDARYADLLRYLDEVMPEPAKIGQAGFRILEGTYAYRLEKGEFRGNFVPGAPPLEFGRHDARHALRTEYTNPVPELFRTSTMLPQGGMGGVLYAYTGQVHLQPLLMPPHMS